jgi:hypothetical protein
MTPGRIWRRTAIERNGRLAPLPDDWSLIDAASGFAIARIHAEPDGIWRCVCRSIVEGGRRAVSWRGSRPARRPLWPLRQRGPDWTPITPKAGSLFHAD